MMLSKRPERHPQSQIPCAGSFLLPAHSCDVDKSLPKEERIADFVRQIKNPYRFRCGDFVVNASFARNGATLEDCLRGILR